MCHLLREIAPFYRFLQNDMRVYSKKMEQIALAIQNESKESSLYALYLSTLPTGRNMLDYIMRLGIQSICETKFTKALVNEFWEGKDFITASKRQYSAVLHAATSSKRFEWLNKFKPDTEGSYAIQFANVMSSPRLFMFIDTLLLMLVYYFLDDFIYRKVDFFTQYDRDPSYLDTLEPYYFDFSYHLNSTHYILDFIVLLNFWVFLLYRWFYVSKEGEQVKFYRNGLLLTFIVLTLLLLHPIFFRNYDQAVSAEVFIKINLVAIRWAVAYNIITTMMGFQFTGPTLTVLGTVLRRFVQILVMLNIYMLLYSEFMNNLFHDWKFLYAPKESFFTMCEVLFGALTFANPEDTDSTASYYIANIFMLIYAFSSNITGMMLMIALMTSTYDEVQQSAAYFNTRNQYSLVQVFKKLPFKGFYSFPPQLSAFTLPFLFLYKIPTLGPRIDMFLLSIKYYLIVVPIVLLAHFVQNIIYYAPLIYCRNLLQILVGKTIYKWRIIHFFGWMIFGPIVIGIYMTQETIAILKIMTKNFVIHDAQEKILSKVTDDNVIYMNRYELVKNTVQHIIKENPDRKVIPFLELLNYLMRQGKITASPGTIIKREKKSALARLAELVRKHTSKKKGQNKWLKNIAAAKRKLFMEILEGFQNYKSYNMKLEDSFLDAELILSLLQSIDINNIIYHRARQIFAVQMVLINAQSKDQISIMNKMEDLEKKIELLMKYVSTPASRDMKLQETIHNY